MILPDSAGLLLLPFELTTSYRKGTSEGPGVLGPFFPGGAAASPVEVKQGGLDAPAYLAEVSRAAEEIAARGRKPAAIGGEHTVTWGVLSGLVRAGIRPAVVQLDAHADMREEYEGSPWSHACVMRRVIEELKLPTLGAGIRSLSIEEADFIRERGRPTLWAHEIHADPARADAAAAALGPEVYLTLDIDVLDPSVAPGTGTPEPGGLGWYAALRLIERLLRGKRLVGFDLVEFCPLAETPVTAAAARGLFESLLAFF